MKQLLQDLSKGHTTLVEAPSPKATAGNIVIATTCSLVSAGTERMLVSFGKSSLIEKARQQPDKVRAVLDKMKTDGVLATIDAVQSKLQQPISLGYSNVGHVVEVGRDVKNFKVGDRVASNGCHADLVSVPKHLCCKIPDEVSDEAAVFTVVASIGLQGLRLARPTLGESVVVTGTGLIGLLTVQLLIAQGCRVLAIDFDETKLALAKKFGATTCNPRTGEDPVAAGLAFTDGKGVDAVIITASTSSNEPVQHAAQMCRARGRIVLVGVTGLEINRADFYQKELSFQVSCSYGPGRYDPEYEEKGHDYPLGYVRWTEQRNFEAILELMRRGQVNTDSLITHRYSFIDAPAAYDTLVKDSSVMGMLLSYDASLNSRISNSIPLRDHSPAHPNRAVLGVIGAGNYSSRVLLPSLQKTNAVLSTIVTSGGVSGVIHGTRTGFSTAASDIESILKNADINSVVIATRHDSHSELVVRALSAGKHVFVEKPLSITMEQLAQVETEYSNSKSMLMIGFNRRFSPHVKRIQQLLAGVSAPKSFVMTVNAGDIAKGHWTQDSEVGGGRIVGEACHFIDLLRFLAGSRIVSSSTMKMKSSTNDTAILNLQFEDGSIGSVNYFSNGNKSIAKERLEIFTEGKVLQLDNFRRLKGYGWPSFKKMNLMRQDKGQTQCIASFIDAVESGGPSPIPVEEIFEVSRVAIELANEY